MEPPFPDPKTLSVDKKYPYCGDSQLSQSLLVSGEGNLQNAVVILESMNPSSKDNPGEKAVLHQKECHFEPHISILAPNASLQITNEDPLAHDVRLFDGASMLSRDDMDVSANPVSHPFSKEGVYTIRCGLHHWMHAFVIVTAQPHALTDSEGKFSLSGVPAGQYRLHLWHETLGEIFLDLEVKESISDFHYTFSSMSFPRKRESKLDPRLEHAGMTVS